MLGRVGERDTALADTWIVNGQMCAGTRQHDEMIVLPVQDAGQAQLLQMVEFGAQRARIEMGIPGDMDQVAQRRALERHIVVATNRGKIHPTAMGARRHGQTRNAALSGLGLKDDRCPAHSISRLSADVGSEALTQAEERLEDPFVQSAPIEQHVGLHLHAAAQGLLAAIDVDVRIVRPHIDSVIGDLLRLDRQ